jgi:glycine amidinotransferase
MQPIQVHHEWGTLKEVIVGIPHFKIPEKIPDHLEKFSASKGLRLIRDYGGFTVRQAKPGLYHEMVTQMEGVIEVLKDRDIKVYRPEIMNGKVHDYLKDSEDSGGIQMFPRDPILVIGNHFIETEPFSVLRRRERFGIRQALSERLSDSDAKIVSMPPVLPPTCNLCNDGMKPAPVLEGGDVLLLGKDIYIGVSGNASNSEGIQWLKQYLGSGYNIREIRLKKEFLHLDCCLATPREGLAIICRDAFVDGLPEFLGNWELIELSFEDSKEKLGCNGLILDDKTIIIHDEIEGLAEKLEHAGQEVIIKPFNAVYYFSGAFRCWHHPLVRESAL